MGVLKADRDEQGRGVAPKELRWALSGGALVAIFGFGMMAVAGGISSFEARNLLDAALPTIRFLASTLVAASTTILALMLALIGITASHDANFKPGFFKRIRQISTLCILLLAGSALLLLFLTVPIDEAEGIQRRYEIVYYLVLAGAASSTGMLVTVMLMLRYAVEGVIDVLTPGAVSPFVVNEEDEEVPALVTDPTTPVADEAELVGDRNPN